MYKVKDYLFTLQNLFKGMNMKNLNLVLVSALSMVALGCSVFPIKAQVEENHFRFENFKRDKGLDLEYVHLMCYLKRPVSWAEPKQYEAGEHNLWVRADVSNRSFDDSTKEAIVNFKVKLESDKSYMLNRKITDDKIAIWIQEVDTGLVVSEILTPELKKPLLVDYSLRKDQCESGSV